MAAAYPHRWAPAMGDSPQSEDGSLTVAGDTWARALAGLTAQQLGRGLEGCLVSANAWPPTVQEFKAKALGIPSFAQVAADLAHKDSQRMPFTIAVWRRVDPWSYRHAPELVAEKMLQRAYHDQYEATMRGEPLPEPLPELEEKPPEPKPASREVAMENIARIRSMLGRADQAAPGAAE